MQAAQDHMVVFYLNETGVEFGSPLSDWAALFRISLLTSQHEEGARKGAINIVCFIPPGQPTAAGGNPIYAVENKRKILEIHP
jgi:hypothetical protein